VLLRAPCRHYFLARFQRGNQPQLRLWPEPATGTSIRAVFALENSLSAFKSPLRFAWLSLARDSCSACAIYLCWIQGFEARNVTVLTINNVVGPKQDGLQQMLQLQAQVAALPKVEGAAAGWWAIFEGTGEEIA